MGSFNVACSISSISIGPGRPVALLPLFPKLHNPRAPHVIGTEPMLIYPNDYFNPFAFPIFGKYDDYGSIEDIEEDDNTRALEAWSGLSIEDFVAVLTCGRKDINDYHSEVFRVYAKDKEALSSYGVRFNALFLTRMGFEILTNEFYKHPGFPYLVRLMDSDAHGDHGYEILNIDEVVVKSNSGFSQPKSSLLADFYELAGVHLNVAKENDEKVKFFLRSSAMFIHGEVYGVLSSDPQPKIDASFLELQNQIIKYDESMALELEDIEQKTEKQRKLAIMRHEMFSDPFGHLRSDDVDFIRFFKEWRQFKQIYEPPIREGKIGDIASRYFSFYWNMYSMNRFFFPAMNGAQEGDHEASKKLYELSLSIVNEELKKQEDW